jgi:hypothetical protein
MKARFQIFKAPFYFVGWLAPANRDTQSQWDHEGILKRRADIQRVSAF